jgi:hypothetical protein
MNQNNIHRIRQVTPEEVAQVQRVPLTQEELQKTHVLNLQEVQEAVRFEKMTSKKPAIFVAVIGFLLITFGTTFQVSQTLSANRAKQNKVEQRSIEKEEPIVEKEIMKSLKCSLNSFNNADGTDTAFTVLYNFTNNKLVGFTKTFHIAVTPGSTVGTTTVQAYLKNYQAFLNQLEGYQISVNPVDNGLVTTVIVDYNLLDLTTVPEIQQTHFSTKIDYAIDTPYETIEQDMKNNNYTCE